MPVVFGTVTKEEYELILALGSERMALISQAAEIRRELGKIEFALNKAWSDIGRKHQIDTFSMPYMLNNNMEIVMRGQDVQ